MVVKWPNSKVVSFEVREYMHHRIVLHFDPLHWNMTFEIKLNLSYNKIIVPFVFHQEVNNQQRFSMAPEHHSSPAMSEQGQRDPIRLSKSAPRIVTSTTR